MLAPVTPLVTFKTQVHSFTSGAIDIYLAVVASVFPGLTPLRE
jgi:hypothetical protein